MEVKHKHVVDLTDRQTIVMMDAVQGDSGRILELEMLSAGEKWPLPEALAVKIRFQKPDGTGGIYDTLPDGTSAWSGEGNVLTVALAPEVCAAAGRVLLQIHLMQGRTQLTTFAMGLRVQPEVEAPQISGDYTNLSAWLDTTGKKVLTEEDTAKIEQLSETTAAFAETAAQVDATLEAMRQQAENGAFDGKSAYEVALEEGFDGTKEEWLASLVGPQGEKGNTAGAFIATYGVTTSAEIEAAYQAGDAVFCRYKPENGVMLTMPLSGRIDASAHYFSVQRLETMYTVSCNSSVWKVNFKQKPLLNYQDIKLLKTLTLAGDPTQPLHAATKQYIDNHAAKLVTGTYVGSNQCGKDYPNSLTFDFAPKLLMIRPLGGQYNMILNLIGATEEYSDDAALAINNLLKDEDGYWSETADYHVIEYGLHVKLVGTTVSWYFNGNSADNFASRYNQCSFGCTYAYMAIG